MQELGGEACLYNPGEKLWGSRVNLCQDLLSSQGEELSPGAASSLAGVKNPLPSSDWSIPKKINTKGCVPLKKVNHGSLRLNAVDLLAPLKGWCDVSVTIPKMNSWGSSWAEPSSILRALRRGLPDSSDPSLGSLHPQISPPTSAFSSFFPWSGDQVPSDLSCQGSWATEKLPVGLLVPGREPGRLGSNPVSATGPRVGVISHPQGPSPARPARASSLSLTLLRGPLL